MTAEQARWVQAKTLRAVARDAIASANRVDPDRRRFIVLENDMSEAADIQTVNEYIEHLKAQIATLKAGQTSPEAAQALADIGTFAAAARAEMAAEPADPAPAAEPGASLMDQVS